MKKNRILRYLFSIGILLLGLWITPSEDVSAAYSYTYSSNGSSGHSIYKYTSKGKLVDGYPTTGSHSFSTSGCTKTCSKCDYSETNHGSSTPQTYTATKHKLVCSKCGASQGTASHSFGSASSAGASGHTYTCACGYSKTESHTLSYTGCTGKCSTCGYSATSHDYKYQSISVTSHQEKCTKCGTSKGSSKAHEKTYSKKDSNQHKVTCSVCGYSGTAQHDFNSSMVCKNCGYEGAHSGGGKCSTNVCYVGGSNKTSISSPCGCGTNWDSSMSGCWYKIECTLSGLDGTVKSNNGTPTFTAGTAKVTGSYSGCAGHSFSSPKGTTSYTVAALSLEKGGKAYCAYKATVRWTGAYKVSCGTCNGTHDRMREQTKYYSAEDVRFCNFAGWTRDAKNNQHYQVCGNNSSHETNRGNHNYVKQTTDSTWQKGPDNHWKIQEWACSLCGHLDENEHRVSEEAHTYVQEAKWHDYTNGNGSTHYKDKVCLKCGYTSPSHEVRTYEKHTYGAWEKVDANTHKRTCTADACGHTQTASHNFGSWEDYSASDHRKKCADCGYGYLEKHKAELTGTSETTASLWSSDATSHWKVKTTTKKYKCSVCGHKLDNDVTKTNVDTSSHSWSVSYGSWTSNGYSGHSRAKTSTCTVCGYTKTETESDSHSMYASGYGSWEYYSTSQHRRNNSYYCSLCSYSTYDYEYQNHDIYVASYGTWSKYDTSQHRRNNLYKCRTCTYSYYDYEYQNHDMDKTWDSWVKVDNTTHKRTRTETCKVCSQVNTYPETANHSWELISTENPAYKSTSQHFVKYTYKCSVCNGTKVEEVNENHKFVATSSSWGNPTGQVTIPTKMYACATCGGNHATHVVTTDTTNNHYRVTSYKCSVCNGGYEVIETQAHTKTYTAVDKDIHFIKCNVCGKTTGTGFGNEAHSFVYTDNRNGYITKTCSKCNYTETNPIQYTLMLDRNLGECNISMRSMKYNESYTLPNCTREGYVLRGWQVYSGSTAYPNCTDTLNSTGAKIFGKGEGISGLTIDNSTTVKLVAVWKKSSPVITLSDITITGNVLRTSEGVYIAKGNSIYDAQYKLNYKELPYHYLTDITSSCSVSGGVLKEGTGYTKTETNLTGEYSKQTVANSDLVLTGVSGGRADISFGYKDKDVWYDSYNSPTNTVTDVKSASLIVFDGDAPEIISTSYDTVMTTYADTSDYNQILGKTVTLEAYEAPYLYYAGLSDESYIKLYNRKNNVTKTLSKTPNYTTDTKFGTRIDRYSFESFTIDGSSELFDEGFDVIIHLVDRLGNAFDRTDSYSAFDIAIDDIGSYTYDRSTDQFWSGEAVYVRIITKGRADSYVCEVTPQVEGIYGSSNVNYTTLKQTVTSDSLTDASSVSVNCPNEDGAVTSYSIFVLPLNGTATRYEVSVTGYKRNDATGEVVTKTDSRYIYVDTDNEIIDGIITIIE